LSSGTWIENTAFGGFCHHFDDGEGHEEMDENLQNEDEKSLEDKHYNMRDRNTIAW
jgi:hypothetical protein